MAKRERLSTGPAGTLAHSEKGIEDRSRPKAEDGLRLMHAFLEIKKAEVREAIIKYVEEQSRLENGS